MPLEKVDVTVENAPPEDRWPSLKVGVPFVGVIEKKGWTDKDGRRWGVGVDAAGQWIRFRKYQYPTMQACEEMGHHEVRPDKWPPPDERLVKVEGGPFISTPGSLSLQCELCGCWCTVTSETNEDQHRIKVVVPAPAKGKAVAA